MNGKNQSLFVGIASLIYLDSLDILDQSFRLIFLNKMKTNHIYQGDCLEVMKTFPDGCIDLVVTSPPYDELRDYKGYSFDFEGIARELYRVTKQGGVVVWVVGDSTVNGSETGTSFKQALYFKQIGFNLHDTMIYAKTNPIPLTHNRYEQQFEYMFVLSNGKPKTFNPIIIDCKTANIEYSMSNENDYGKNSAKRPRDELLKVKETKLKYNIWFFNTAISLFTNSAPFPEQLAEDHIISWSEEGDIVLDPMCGSGTTCKMAKYTNRKYIGIEISEDYCKIAEERLSQEVFDFKD